jgi:hypothetical protein
LINKIKNFSVNIIEGYAKLLPVISANAPYVVEINKNLEDYFTQNKYRLHFKNQKMPQKEFLNYFENWIVSIREYASSNFQFPHAEIIDSDVLIKNIFRIIDLDNFKIHLSVWDRLLHSLVAFICNFIPFKSVRRKARRKLQTKFCFALKAVKTYKKGGKK